jgi:hypothetical protein
MSRITKIKTVLIGNSADNNELIIRSLKDFPDLNISLTLTNVEDLELILKYNKPVIVMLGPDLNFGLLLLPTG